MGRITLSHPSRTEPIDIELQQTSGVNTSLYNVQFDRINADLEIEAGASGAGWLRLQGEITPYYAVRRKNRIEVWIEGRTYAFDVVDRAARRAGTAAAAAMTDLKAPMPGTILRIEVQDGDAFEAHQPLIIMESMKMEMTLSAPAAGKVKEITCQAGELVEMNELLARLEAADDV